MKEFKKTSIGFSDRSFLFDLSYHGEIMLVYSFVGGVNFV